MQERATFAGVLVTLVMWEGLVWRQEDVWGVLSSSVDEETQALGFSERRCLRGKAGVTENTQWPVLVCMHT